MKTHSLNSKQEKNIVFTLLYELERLAKNKFSALQNAFIVHNKNLLTA
jgi:hypothetical protein